MSKTMNRICGLAFACAALLPGTAPAWASDTTINVELWDRGNHMGMMNRFGMGMGLAQPHPMSGIDGIGPMGIAVNTKTMPAGQVTFNVTNISTDLIHEMIVAPVADTSKQLPYDTALGKVDEEAAGHLGEVSELDPGAKGSVTLNLQPGTYILYCNLPGHYASGMWTLIMVQ